MKQKIKIILNVTLLALGLVTSQVYAEEDNTGAYVGGSLGYLRTPNLSGRVDTALSNLGLGTSSSSKVYSVNPSLKIGYSFTNNLAVEGTSDRVGNTKLQTTINSPVSDITSGTWGSRGYGLHVLGSTALDRQWTLTGRVGLEKWQTSLNLASAVGGSTMISNTSKHTSLALGAGLSYAVSENVDVTYDFMHYNGVGDLNVTGQTSVYAFTVGMRYRFTDY